jgi:hypothetical protein
MAERAFQHAEQTYGWNRQVAAIEAAVFDRTATRVSPAGQVDRSRV